MPRALALLLLLPTAAFAAPYDIGWTDVAKVEVHLDRVEGPSLKLVFTPAGRERMATFTAAHTGETMELSVAGTAVGAPVIREAVDAPSALLAVDTEAIALQLATGFAATTPAP